jgi:uncharacterized protein YndB with AHSA1/START domain
MDFKFTVSGRIAKPVHEVFEAVADPKKLSGYFTTGGAQGRLETGATVTWDFHDFPGAFPVEVVEVENDKRIVLRWDADDGDKTTVTMNFEPLDDNTRTLVSITESISNTASICVKAFINDRYGHRRRAARIRHAHA